MSCLPSAADPDLPASAESRLKGNARLEALSFSDLAGWPDDDHGEAFRAFLRSCRALEAQAAELRPAKTPDRIF